MFLLHQVLEQLFSRLDVDGDGRISFEEFVHMFQNGGPSGNTSLVLDDSLPPVCVCVCVCVCVYIFHHLFSFDIIILCVRVCVCVCV